MARTWLSVTVELLGGRGEHLWPWPGRVFAVGPSHTFLDLADAINDAFARWGFRTKDSPSSGRSSLTTVVGAGLATRSRMPVSA